MYSNLESTLQGYEESLSKFKDERDSIQKKTFTKWVNKHLKKIGRRVDNLFEDLRDGHNLVSLLEVLSGDNLPRERGLMRFHMLQNVQTSLDYLRYRKIKLVNIRAEDIVDSNPKLTLGLIWTIILHFQISDIMVGQDESLTAREALLRWSQRSTAKYPGVRVKNFTSSWKDGLAFNAIIHRTRPDLVDWRSLKTCDIRDRLESAFSIVEREYGVTRLLDPEDVDTSEPDEKSLITYISSLYDVFPNPPALHPLYDPEAQKKYGDYRDLSSSFRIWIRESTLLMQDRNFPSTLVEVKSLALESKRFRTDEVPRRLREKQRLDQLYNDIEKFLEETEEMLEPDLRPETFECDWNQLLLLQQERDDAIHREIERLEKLQRIAEKLHREAKQFDIQLDDVETRIDEEAKRIDRHLVGDAAKNCDILSGELATIEESIKNMFAEVQVLKDGSYNQASDLLKRVQRIHHSWELINAVFQTRLLEILPSLTSSDAERSSSSSLESRLIETNQHFEFLRECSEWVQSQLTQMEKAAYGTDLSSVGTELDLHLKIHQSVDEFQGNLEKCISNQNKFQGEESPIYVHYLAILQQSYSELTMASKKRLVDLQSLQEFIQSVMTELARLNEKEEVEISRDWSSKLLNLIEIQTYYEELMSDLEKREIQVSAVQGRGEALVKHHPAFECVETFMLTLSSKWKWLLKLTLCLETHLRHANFYENFFTEVRKCEEWCIKQDQLLNSTYSQSGFTLDEGEQLLREMQDLRDDLSHYSKVVEELCESSLEVVPLKQRGSPLLKPVAAKCICIYKQHEVNIGKDEKFDLVDKISARTWKVVTGNGLEYQVPSVCLVIRPPDNEAIEAAERLKRQYYQCEALWIRKQMRMSQNMIFATIKVVKSWDAPQFMSVGKDQRDAILKALNEDTEKLLQQGDPSDPQLRCLQRKIEEVNQLFCDFEKREATCNRLELSQLAIDDQLATLQMKLEEFEMTLTSMITSPLPRDLDQLEQFVVNHRQFETELQSLQLELESMKENVEACPCKTPQMQTKIDSCNSQWKKLWENSNLYVERLKGSEIVLNGLEVMNKFVSCLETQLISKNMQYDPEALRKVHDDLIDMQSNIQIQQDAVDQLAEEASVVRQLVIRSRNSVNTTIRKHPDVDRLDAEINAVLTRLDNIRAQVVERLQICVPTVEHQESSAKLQVNHPISDAANDASSKMPSIMNGIKTESSLSVPSVLDADQDNASYDHSEDQTAIEQHSRELAPCLDVDERMNVLKKAMAIVKEFQDKFFPIANWLDEMESKIKEMEVVATDEERIQKSIEEHSVLHDDILGRRPDFDSLANNFTDLMSLVTEEEANVLADRLAELTDRYGALVENSEALGRLLGDAKNGLRHLVLSYEDLLTRMESMESKLKDYSLSVHVEKLQGQMEELVHLTEEVARYQRQIESVVDTGLELMRHITNEEALQLQEKLDFIQRRYMELTVRADELLKEAHETQPVVEQFHLSHNRLANYLLDAEDRLQALDSSSTASSGSAGLHVQECIIAHLEKLLIEVRPFLDMVNQNGPLLCRRCPDEGAAYIESLITRDNRRFDAVHEQMQRKTKRLRLYKQRLVEVVSDLDELLDWFREMEQQVREAEPPSCDPRIIGVQLKEHKSVGEEISSQKGRIRDILSASQTVLRQSPQTEDSAFIREKMEDLKEIRDHVSELNADRLSILEQALHLAKHFHEAHSDLSNWLDEIEESLANADDPAIHLKQIDRQQEVNKLLMSEIAEYKPIFEKLNKTGSTLAQLCLEEEGVKVHDIIELHNARYAALRSGVRERQKTLEEALQETSQFSDKLNGMLTALTNAFEQVKSAEPISAHLDKIQEEIQENESIVEDLKKRESAFEAVKRIADEIIMKNPSDSGVKDIIDKLKKLSDLWETVNSATEKHGKSLEEALGLSKHFWEELQIVLAILKELQGTLATQDPPAVEPTKIRQQQANLQYVRTDIEKTQPKVEHCRQVGQELINLCGEPDKPEVKKHIEELDSTWDNVTTLYIKREENLINAMERSMEYHDILNTLYEFLETAEEKFRGMRPLGTDIETVKQQIEQLKAFKAEVDPHMIKVETLNRQASDLLLCSSPDQVSRLKEPLAKVNRRWEDFLRGVVDMQRELEKALLHLGQFQHALNELLVWIQRTDSTLNELKPAHGDPSVIELELVKLKVFINDVQAHQSTVDTLNDASRNLFEADQSSDDPNNNQKQLALLNKKWGDMVEKASNRQQELEDALKEAEQFTAEIQDLMQWLNEIDNALSMSKPVGGLPETASDQLELFMEIYQELEKNLQLVERCHERGADYLNQSTDRAASSLQRNLETLKQRWDNIMKRANDKKIKLEIALKEATELHDALQVFIEWLTNAEKTLSGFKPVSRVMETVVSQIEDHKSLQKGILIQRDAMGNLDKKGTHSKYFSQKQDVILIKNLLISVQHRWERVLSRAAERTRALDHAYKEAKEFHDSWHKLYSWLEEAEKGFDDAELKLSSDPEKIKQLLAKHTEFQQILDAKKPGYDGVVRLGKLIKDRAPKTDESTLNLMMSDMKAKWQSVCNQSVDRQRKLEEGLLFSGQFEDAIKALVDWLCKTDRIQMAESPVHGDLDTVMALREQHSDFEEELQSRFVQAEQVQKMAVDVMAIASEEDKTAIEKQVSELEVTWDNVSKASNTRSVRLEEALVQSETLHKAVNVLLEWFSDALTKLRFAGPLPDEETEALQQLDDHHKCLEELIKKETDKDDIMAMAQDILEKAHPDAVPVIHHLITVVQSRWEEVMAWANQREQRLKEHLCNVREMASILEELLAWLSIAENTMDTLEAEPLPDDLPFVEILVKDHQDFMEDMAKRQPEMDRFCRTRTPDRENSQIPRILRSSYKPPSGQSTHGLQQSTRKSSKVNLEGSPCSPRARHLWDRWRNVWMMAWERQRRLQDKLNYLQEIEKVKNFSWDDWRRRFMKYMNNKKSRVTDLFRRIDRNNEGFIPREDFIDGIVKTKFPSSRIEMNVVANMFDRNNEGSIEWKEFLTALRPDWEERPTTEDEIIQDEVERAVNQCTCRNAFKVHQVTEGQYRFGENQKLRLIRILRSTVMVRVGGGWEALGEFLVKNDPCRVKGKTNFELREQFLPEGTSQGMTLFKSRMSPNSSVSSQLGSSQTIFSPLHTPSPSLTTAGPISKVRERIVRNKESPLLQSLSVGTPDTSVSESDGSFQISRKTPAPRKSMINGSRSGSRSTSRLLDSRNRSVQSLDGYDGGSVQNTPIGSRRSLKQPSWSCTLPRKRPAVPSLSLVETRARYPSGLSASGISSSPSGGFNGGAISAASRSRILRTSSASSIPILTSTPARDHSDSGPNSTCIPDTPKTMRGDPLTAVVRKVASTGIRKPSSMSTFRPSPK